MYALWHRALALAVVLVAATVPGFTQEVGVVSGRVTDESGVPMNDVEVTLSSPGIPGLMSTLTDQAGRYWFPAVPGNHPLTVHASAPGRNPMKYVGFTARRGSTVTVNFTLRRPGDHDILVLIEGGVPYHKLALEGALSTMPGEVTTFEVSNLKSSTARRLSRQLEARPNAVLAIGEKAARLARRHIKDVPIVYSMVPAPMDTGLAGENLCGVPLNGGFSEQIEHLRHVLPEARRVGTIYNPMRMARSLHELRDVAAAEGMELVAAHIHGDDENDVLAALDQLADEPLDAFLVLLDPEFLDVRSFGHLARFAQSRDLVLAVPDASLAVHEKSFAFAPGFRKMGVYAGTLVRRIVEEKAEPSDIGMIYPDSATLAWDHSWRSPEVSEVLPGDPPVTMARDE